MLRIACIMIIATVSALLVHSSAFAGEGTQSKSDKRATFSKSMYTVSGLASPGSHLHDLFMGALDGVSEVHPIRFSMTLPKGLTAEEMLSGRTSELTAINADSKQGSDYEHAVIQSNCCSYNPPEPTGPAEVNDVRSFTNHCADVGVSFPLYATVNYTWEYKNTVDSNGDGEKDSEPEWQLTEYEIEVYYDQVRKNECL